jgi:hypothetical protein
MRHVLGVACGLVAAVGVVATGGHWLLAAGIGAFIGLAFLAGSRASR